VISTRRLAAPLILLTLAAPRLRAEGDPDKGKALFQTCAGCHNVSTDARKMGPSLRSLFGRVTLRNGKHADDENVRAIVLDGYNGMPSFRYSFKPEEIDDLMAYLHTLKARPEPAAASSEGAAYFKAWCARCHKPEDLRGRYQPDWLPLIANGHHGAPPLKDWLDPEARQTLATYLKTVE
jgi:cytochrome c2